jgi:Dolichyl-phosphate-mannose-protein mannosyltransferase
MSLSALNALPAKIARKVPESRLKDFLNEFNTARSMTILFSVAVASLVFYWSRSLYGVVPAFASLLLYIFDPNIIAHSQLVTSDVYALGAITFTFYSLWRFANQRTRFNGLLCALALGLAQLAKYTSVVLLPLCFVTLLIYDLSTLLAGFRRKEPSIIRQYVIHYLMYGFTGLVSIILFLNIGFLFHKSFVPFGEYKFRSDLFQSLQQDHPNLDALPVPTPYPYLDGLDWVIYRERTHASFGNIYLLGETRRLGGFPGYFFVASLLKVPLASQIIFFAALAVYIFDRNRRSKFLSDELFLFTPVLFYSIYFNYFYNAQIGIRFFLVVFPFLYVFAGNLFKGWQRFSILQKGVSLALGVYLVISVLSYYPYYLTYFNEIVWDKTQTYKYLADSNIDWGQSRNEYRSYLTQHPDAVTELDRPAPAHLIININKLVGVVTFPETYAWLRENFEPVDTLANNFMIYKITPEQIQELCERSPDECK